MANFLLFRGRKTKHTEKSDIKRTEKQAKKTFPFYYYSFFLLVLFRFRLFTATALLFVFCCCSRCLEQFAFHVVHFAKFFPPIISVSPINGRRSFFLNYISVPLKFPPSCLFCFFSLLSRSLSLSVILFIFSIGIWPASFFSYNLHTFAYICLITHRRGAGGITQRVQQAAAQAAVNEMAGALSQRLKLN